ncbi:nucleotidyl transferase, partial [Methanocorpusculum sp.]|nr:nucleotidyl transferase [Methanocorpusculum sp.]
ASYSFGTIIGDRTTVGAFTRFKGAVIGNNVEIDGGKLIETEIPSDTRVM